MLIEWFLEKIEVLFPEFFVRSLSYKQCPHFGISIVCKVRRTNFEFLPASENKGDLKISQR